MSDLGDMVATLTAKGFKLGGSRRMAEKYPDAVRVKDDTDWDFYAADTQENAVILRSLGFEEKEHLGYWDDLLSEMYKHPELPIEVLLRSDVETYSRAFESISAREYMTKLLKSSPIRDPDISKLDFRNAVCDRFNALFRKHRTQRRTA